MISAMTILALLVLTLVVARLVLLRPTRNPSVDDSVAHTIAGGNPDSPPTRWLTA
jgi:hypothetical protein